MMSQAVSSAATQSSSDRVGRALAEFAFKGERRVNERCVPRECLKAETERGAHPEHGRVLAQDLARDALEPNAPPVGDETLHQAPAEAVALEIGAHDDRELA